MTVSVEVTIDRDGRHLQASCFMPKGEGPFPAVVLLKGFPSKSDDVLGLGNRLSNAGIFVLTFHYSGTMGSSGKFSFENAQKDIAAAFAGYADVKRSSDRFTTSEKLILFLS